MSLRARLSVFYAAGLLLPLGAYLGFYRPWMSTSARQVHDLDVQTQILQKKAQQLADFPARIAALTPPKPPSVEESLDTLASLRVPGLVVERLAQDPTDPGAIQLGLRGGYREVVAYLEAAQALPFPARVRFLDLSPLPEAGLLSGTLRVEVAP